MHLQSLKYAEELEHVTGKEFAHSVGIRKSYGTEFNKMKNIVNRLKFGGRLILLGELPNHMNDQCVVTVWFLFRNPQSYRSI
ncbi:HTH-like domain-containing protein [Pseudovibrio brasiliensis]|uniref:HTH-like domain-containing protein n=1 Tax=Pseudovibrio brasiliensis TaxID=1898042 RepID=UPI003CC821A7